MQPGLDLKPGDILQIRPKAECYGGQFCVFVQGRESGVSAKVYVRVRDGVVYLVFGWEDLEPTGGRTIWRPSETRPKPSTPRPAAAPPAAGATTAPVRRHWQPLNEALSTLTTAGAHG